MKLFPRLLLSISIPSAFCPMFAQVQVYFSNEPKSDLQLLNTGTGNEITNNWVVKRVDGVSLVPEPSEARQKASLVKAWRKAFLTRSFLGGHLLAFQFAGSTRLADNEEGVVSDRPSPGRIDHQQTGKLDNSTLRMRPQLGIETSKWQISSGPMWAFVGHTTGLSATEGISFTRSDGLGKQARVDRSGGSKIHRSNVLGGESNAAAEKTLI